MFLSKFFKRSNKNSEKVVIPSSSKEVLKKNIVKQSSRKGELGEYKIAVQLSQFSKEYKVLHDLLIPNTRSKSGYSQIDHVLLSPFGIFVIETKNFQGTIYGSANQKQWLVNGKFKFMNPFIQNYGHIESLKSLIDPKYKNSFISLVSFTKRCTLKTDLGYRNIQSSELIVYDTELTETINRKEAINKLLQPEPMLSKEDIEKCYSQFLKVNVLNKDVRELHIKLIKGSTSN
ncbi:nuclease-related domain-containing protein [Fictibacillus barbaricus]|uniref:NERD domain-containing protein n=1 Tax=Fictibacillus barbaricus TaxID=182136 RepID=A0ABS2ZIE2_9BACL|nr:nuclease-related domain-containing protein [Fictibacillus barbaricus]MBN3546470.1 NERD domain-containing protein [Fictibacillus barbaricus]GGB41297.1 hypothetical protein GCM10007199_03180 [Fictibacillus barbaricus]